MLKRLCLAIIITVVSATSSLAAGPYLSASGGVSIYHDSDIGINGTPFFGTTSYDPGFGFNVAAGYDADVVRGEFEFGYKDADLTKFWASGGNATVSDTDVAIWSYMFNAYIDLKNQYALTPFVGVGLGVLRAEFNQPGFDRFDTELGYQFTVGASYRLGPQVNFDLSYRYQSTVTDFEKEGFNLSYQSSNVLVGLRYQF